MLLQFLTLVFNSVQQCNEVKRIHILIKDSQFRACFVLAWVHSSYNQIESKRTLAVLNEIKQVFGYRQPIVLAK